jgi:hypothetical protein
VEVICQNPLVIYLNPTQEQEMLHKCVSTRLTIAVHGICDNMDDGICENVDDEICQNATTVGMVVVGSMVVAFTILVEWHALRTSWLDAIGPILFLFSFISQLFSIITYMTYLDPPTLKLLSLGCDMVSLGGIVVSIEATILNWQTHKFDSRTPSVIHNLPFLG